MDTIANWKGSARKVCGLLVISAAFGLAIPSMARAQDVNSSAPIEGTWVFNIYRVTQGFSFSALQSFTAGGVTLATGTIDRTPPPPISPLYGSWRRVRGNSYVATICFFAFDPTGNAVAMIKTNESFHLTDHNNVVGTGSAQACDINGDNCVDVPLPITITGKRIIAHGA